MSRSTAYRDGFREASKLAVSTVHEEANKMNDPRARAALDSTAHLLGVVMKTRLEMMDDQPDT